MLDMVEQAPRQGLDQVAFGLQRIDWWRIVLDPVAVVEDALLAFDQADRAIAGLSGHFGEVGIPIS